MFLFKGEDVFKEIHKLSGGERARVELVKLILKKVNFLILDEPTNHLDIQSREALENALSGYDGTMLIVSHDRYFVNKLANRIVHFEQNGLTSYAGDYDYYVEKRKIDDVEEEKAPPKDLDYKEQKRIAAEKRKVINRFAKVEDEIAKMENNILEKNKELEVPEIMTDYVRATEITNEINLMNADLEKLYEEWDLLQVEIEENGYNE